MHRTPVLTCSYLDQLSGYKLFFKCENSQKTGSFKVNELCFVNNLIYMAIENVHHNCYIITSYVFGCY